MAVNAAPHTANHNVKVYIYEASNKQITKCVSYVRQLKFIEYCSLAHH